MAFNSKDANSGSEKKLYTGLTTVNVVAVNPTADEKVALYGGELRDEPTYIGKDQDGNDQIRIEFHVDSNVDDSPEKERVRTSTSFYVSNKHLASSTGKMQVTNKFGQFSWFTEEDFNAGVSPYSWFSTIGLRLAYRGEEDLLNFIKNLLNVPNLKSDMSNVSDAEACFENVPAFFTGNISEVASAVKSTNNKIKLLFGVKTTDEGKMYQAIYNKKAERAYSTNSEYIAKALKESKDNGAYLNVEFGQPPFTFQEYSLNPSTPSEIESTNSNSVGTNSTPGGWGKQ